MGTTANYALRYPALSDTPDGATQIENLAEDVDAALDGVANPTFSSYTPAVGNGGTVTWTTRTGWYAKHGKWVFFNVYLVVNAAGSGASGVTIDAPSNIDRTTRQPVAGLMLQASAHNGSLVLQANTSGSGATFDRLNDSGGTQITGAMLTAGAVIAIQGSYREA
ncbi:MAG TPA: hypothetical protein VH641_14845 [Streptosporangiaceae bacterium]